MVVMSLGALFLNWLLVALAPLPAQPPSPQDPSSRLARLQQQHAEAEKAYQKAAEALPETPEGQQKFEKLFKEHDKQQVERFEQVLAIAQADPTSESGFAALEWLLTIPRTYFVSVGKPAMELALKHHVTNPKIGKSIAWLGYYLPRRHPNEVPALALIRAVQEKNPDTTARGQAAWALAMVRKREFDAAEHQKAANLPELEAGVERAYEKLIKDYGQCPRLLRANSGMIGDFARAELFELRHLRIGKVAPDIEGEDLQGKKFKLSDYRGKVVMLDFWGFW